jgi:uncharacterized membrane protein
MIPQLLQGADPVPLAIAVASVVTVVTILLTEGFRRASLAAIVGTIAGLAITGILSAVVSVAAQFSAAGTEDLLFLQIAAGEAIDVRGILLAAFILGGLGVLDDVTVTQATTVTELAQQGSRRGRELWIAAMRVGRAHIGATVNTLFLAYLGASLPLLLLFTLSQQPATLLVNSEIVAVEIVRTLVGSLGIIAAVPLTTAIAVAIVGRPDRDPQAYETSSQLWVG